MRVWHTHNVPLSTTPRCKQYNCCYRPKGGRGERRWRQMLGGYRDRAAASTRVTYSREHESKNIIPVFLLVYLSTRQFYFRVISLLCFLIDHEIYYYPAPGRGTAYVFGRFLCFFVRNITRKRLDRFAWNFQGRCGVTMGRPHSILGQFG